MKNDVKKCDVYLPQEESICKYIGDFTTIVKKYEEEAFEWFTKHSIASLCNDDAGLKQAEDKIKAYGEIFYCFKDLCSNLNSLCRNIGLDKQYSVDPDLFDSCFTFMEICYMYCN